jgi:putative PEP-CTERM system histidine kinase
MTLNIGLLSYLTALIAFAFLTQLMVIRRRDTPFGITVVAASSLSMLWAGVVTVGTVLEYPPVKLMQLTEVLRNSGWLFLLLQMTSLRFGGEENVLFERRWVPTFLIAITAILAVLFLTPSLSRHFSLRADLYTDIAFATWLAMAIIGLLLLEQIYRNATPDEHWSLRYLCLGLGIIYTYDFFMYAEGLLFRQQSSQLWQARGMINAIAVPLLAISIVRNTDWKLHFHVSRQVAFHSATLLGAGLYLIMMALAGYFIKFLGGNWGGVLQISFLIATGALLVALLFSGRIRSQIRVFLSKHFFSYKYDYREEWQNFTRTLASNKDAPEGIIQAMAPLAQSTSGALWGGNNLQHFTLLSHWQMPEPEIGHDLENLGQWLQRSEWVIDVDELMREPDIYDNLLLPAWLTAIARIWLIIPLMLGDKLQGILILRHSELQHSINWEDRDLLKTAGRQSASHLAQYLANEALVEARQFDAFNRLSAYVVHDLKNILAQQSLIVSNAPRHKHNPDFVDDMISTVENSVSRMTRLVEQMRSGNREAESTRVDLGEILREAVNAHRKSGPQLSLKLQGPALFTEASHERLYTVFGHLVQNAMEASKKTGSVEVRMRRENNNALIEIEDKGVGMDPEFIKKRLFKPFDSTKGLTGMGIGAFESREFIRGVGGDIRVTSTPGKGSLFQVYVPCTQTVNEEYL